MPSTKRSRIRAPKKPFAKRARTTTLARRNIVRVPNTSRFNYGPFPSKLETTLKYHTQAFIGVPIAGAPGYYVFSCNGLFDPDVTGVGHQPMYFDQLMAVYNHYTVTSSKIKVSLAANANPAILTFGILVDDDANPNATTISTFCERPGARYVTGSADGSTGYAPAVSHSWNARNIFTGDPLSKLELQGTETANPIETSNFVIFANNITGAAISQCYFNVTLEYTAVFREPKSMSPS